MDAEGKRRYIEQRFGQKARSIGPKAPQIKKVQDINKNRKGNTGMHIAVEGIWANSFVLRYRVEILYLLCAPESIHTAEGLAMLEALGDAAEHLFLVSAKTLDGLAESGNAAGLLSVCVFPTRSLQDLEHLHRHKKLFVIVLDGLEIPGNVGTVVRSADGTDVDAVIITNKKTRLTHPKFIRSSQGSCFRVPVIEAPMEETKAWLQAHGYELLLADTEGATPFYEEAFAVDRPLALVLGGERHGIHRDWYGPGTRQVSIPMFGDCDSLNVGIAATILMYEASLKRKHLRR